MHYQKIVPEKCSIIFCKDERLCFGEREVSVRKLESRRETGYS